MLDRWALSSINPSPIVDNSKVNLSPQGILDMGCHELTHGWFHGHLQDTQLTAMSSAEVVAWMIAAEMKGDLWTPPEWLPHRYLTFVRDAAED